MQAWAEGGVNGLKMSLMIVPLTLSLIQTLSVEPGYDDS